MTELTDLERDLGDGIADGRLTIEDADMIRRFAAFLADPEVGPPGQGLPVSALRRHQEILGLTDEDLLVAERKSASVCKDEAPP